MLNNDVVDLLFLVGIQLFNINFYRLFACTRARNSTAEYVTCYERCSEQNGVQFIERRDDRDG